MWEKGVIPEKMKGMAEPDTVYDIDKNREWIDYKMCLQQTL